MSEKPGPYTPALISEGDLAVLQHRAEKAEKELTLCMLDRKKERDEVRELRLEIKTFTAAMWDAIECVQVWSAYASDYFKEKHDLAGDLARLRATLKGKPGK